MAHLTHFLMLYFGGLAPFNALLISFLRRLASPHLSCCHMCTFNVATIFYIWCTTVPYAMIKTSSIRPVGMRNVYEGGLHGCVYVCMHKHAGVLPQKIFRLCRSWGQKKLVSRCTGMFIRSKFDHGVPSR